MEVVRSYDIARLVLGYLKENKQEKAAKSFCKSSPYLAEENDLLQKGFWPVSLRHNQLSDMIREYCQIQSEVVQFIDSLAEQNILHIPNHGSLLAKVSFLIKFIKDSVSENTTKCQGTKRRKSYLDDGQEPVEATQEKDLPGYSPPVKKKRRVSSTFLYLATNRPKCPDISSDGESSILESVGASSSKHCAGKFPRKEQTKVKSTATVSSKADDHSPPSEEKTIIPVPSLPVIAEALLEHKEFQNKLVENINKVLSSGPPPSAQKNVLENKNPALEKPSDDIALQFEEMIKSILDETEKDPTFTDLVENIVLSNNVPESESLPVSQATQCSPQNEHSNVEVNVAGFPGNESSIKDRLRPRKANTGPADVPKENRVDDTLNTPCKELVSDSDNKVGPGLNNTSLALSKMIVVKSNETITTSTPLISDSFLNQLGDNILIDMSTGQSIPFLMSSELSTFFLNTSNCGSASQDLQLGKIIDSKNLQTMNIMSQEITSMPSAKKGIVEENPMVCASSSKITTVPTVVGLPLVNAPPVADPIATTSVRPVSEQSKTIEDGATPSVSVPGTDLMRSLSTPRRRSSHIRVLNFTPPKAQSEVKVTVVPPTQRNTISVATTDTRPKHTAISQITAEPVAVDARITANPAAAINESSNSSSNNGFVRTGSDVTVIHHSISETPKRMSQGRQSCARVLSRSGSEETDTSSQPKEKVSKKQSARKATVETEPNKKPKRTKKDKRKQTEVPPTPLKADIPTKEDALEEWNRLRAISSGQWDQHMREVCAWEQTVNPPPPSARKKRRKGKLARKQNASNDKTINTASPVQDTTDSKKAEAETSPEKPSAKKALIEFKIATPLKLGKSPGKNKLKTTDALREQVKASVQQPAGSSSSEIVLGKSEQRVPVTMKMPHHESTIADPSKFTKALLESRSHNIGLLLDTPLKLETAGVPATPGFLIPDSNMTPMVRVPLRAQISICKNPDLPTPTYAITPGAGLPTFDNDTPRSGYLSNYPTDYSSGSSYYRPDESEDLDKNLDAMLAERRRSVKERPVEMTLTELREVLQEDSSNQTVVTAINRSADVRLPVVDFPKVLERIASPPKLAVLPHYTLAEGLPTDASTPSIASDSSLGDKSSSGNSSTSSSSSSSAKSESDSGSKTVSTENDDSDLSWNQSELEELAKKSGQGVEGLLNDEGEVRYPIRTWITPKKFEKTDATEVLDEKVDKRLADVVDKIKGKPVSQVMQTKQLESLEQKRLRMKNKLDKDFSAIEPKRSSAGTIKKAKVKLTTVDFKKAITVESTKATTQRTKNVTAQSTKVVMPSKSKSVTAQKTKAEMTQKTKAETQNTDKTKIDVMKALNLSLKESHSAESVDLFETEEPPKLRVDEDSKDSAESVEVRKAAYALTKLKSSRECFSKKDIKPASIQSQKKNKKSTDPPSKGHPKKKALESTVVDYIPHKPVTRRDSKNIQKNHTVTDNITTDKVNREIDLDYATTDNVPGGIVCFQKNLLNTNEEETIISINTGIPQFILPNDANTPVTVSAYESLKPSTSDAVDLQRKKIAVPVANINPFTSKHQANTQPAVKPSAEQQEEIDPYVKCKLTSIDENDSTRCTHIIYNARESKNNDQYLKGMQSRQNLSSMSMNVFLNGTMHQMQVTEEVDLFSQVPAKTNDKSSTKEDRHKSSASAMSKGKPQLPIARKVSREQTEMSEVDCCVKNTSAGQIQPKINIRYKQTSTTKDRGKLKTETVTSKGSRKSPAKTKETELKERKETTVPKSASSEPTPANSSLNAPGTETKAAELKNEDIFAVLSHIHGNEK